MQTQNYAMGSIRAPGLALIALEARVGWEYGASLALMPLLRTAPRGDAHPVLVLPGLGADDTSTRLLRAYLTDQGYQTFGWGLGRNLGPRPGVAEFYRARLSEIYAESGRKISLVGWSLGGIYARDLAWEMPDKVRGVITLGTPFTGNPKASNARRYYEAVSGERVGHADDKPHRYRSTPPVPTTSIYSRTDGVVAWQNSLEREGPLSENIEVESSHIGMGVNPAVLYAIADRLAQPEDKWKRFDQGFRSLLYKNLRH
jgi:hypothetical protein